MEGLCHLKGNSHVLFGFNDLKEGSGREELPVFEAVTDRDLWGSFCHVVEHARAFISTVSDEAEKQPETQMLTPGGKKTKLRRGQGHEDELILDPTNTWLCLSFITNLHLLINIFKTAPPAARTNTIRCILLSLWCWKYLDLTKMLQKEMETDKKSDF